MDNKKAIRKALRLQKLMRNAKKSSPAKIGKERYIGTSQGNVRVLEYGLDSPQMTPLYVDMHGGGFVLGSADMDEPICHAIREATNVKIVSIDYPKAPKNPYPAALEAIYDIVKYYAENSEKYNIDCNNIGIGGHSAGANFATVLCIMANDRGDFALKYQVLDYPPCDLSISAFDKPCPKGAVPPEMAEMFDICYFNQDKSLSRLPYVSPIYASHEQLSKMPPALLITAGLDSLHDEGIRYGELLQAAGVSVELHDFPDSVHGFTCNKTPDAKEGLALIADFINRHI